MYSKQKKKTDRNQYRFTNSDGRRSDASLNGGLTDLLIDAPGASGSGYRDHLASEDTPLFSAESDSGYNRKSLVERF